jgi:hypothetical protein
MGREAAATVNSRDQQRDMLELVLGAEWSTRITAQLTGPSLILSREGRGDRVTAHRGNVGAVVIDDNWILDPFQRPKQPDTKMFLTFNRSDDANRVQDILTALAWVNKPNVELTCTAEYAQYCLFAAAVSHQPVKLKADLSSFTGSDQDFLDHFFVPGIQRAGGLALAKALAQ